MKSKQDLRKVFENGDKPRQEDFWEWQDSYWHKEEDIIPSNRVDLSGKVEKDASNLTLENVMSWKEKLIAPLEIDQLNF